MKKILMVLAGAMLLLGSAMTAFAENDGNTFICPNGNVCPVGQECVNFENCPVQNGTMTREEWTAARDKSIENGTFVCPAGNEDCIGEDICNHTKRGCMSSENYGNNGVPKRDGRGHRNGGRGHHRGYSNNI